MKRGFQLAAAVATALAIIVSVAVWWPVGTAGREGSSAVSTGASALPSGTADAISRAARPGDLVFRRGSGMWSEMASAFARRDGRFSHVGVIGFDTAQVIHAIGDPLDAQGVVKREPLAVFLKDARDAGLYRMPLTPEQRAAFVREVGRHASAGTPFDPDFSLESQDALYCTELIWHAARTAIGHDPAPAKSQSFGRPYIGLDDLMLADDVLAVTW